VLRFHLLGPVEVWRGDQQILPSDWRTRQTLAVLKLLLDQHDRLVSFERLGDLVWPDSDADAARTSLRGAVRTIRRVLEPDLPTGGASRYVHTDASGYSFRRAGSWVDVDAFEAACRLGAAAARRGDAEAAVRAYREAAGLYRGDYLAGDLYSDWALDRRERLRAAHLDALERLASLLAEAGQHEEAIGLLERALAADPLREELYRRLMLSQAATGRRSHALAVYERARRLLDLELGSEPAPEIQRLRERILTGNLMGAEQAPAPPEASELPLPFVGRERELQVLAEVWSRTRTEAGHLVLIRGAAGVGKTRLARYFADRGGTQLRVVWLAAHEAELELPFAPLRSTLAGWLGGTANAALLSRLGGYAPVLAVLFPQVRTVWPGCPPLEGGRPDASQLFEALTQALLLVAGSGPSVVVLDDLHWSDPSTVLWLGYFARRRPAGMLVVATSRSGQDAADGTAGLLSSLRASERLTEIDLEDLSEAAVRRLLGPTDEGSSTPLAGVLFDASRGNPLFLIEILRELRRQGRAYATGSGWRLAEQSPGIPLPLPASVRSAIRARVRRLQPGPREVLTAVCVLGVPCTAALVADLVGSPLTEVLGDLEILMATQFLRATVDGRAYEVEHPLVRRVAYEDLSPGRRQDWHRRTAMTLERAHADHPPAVAGQVLRHLLAGEGATEDVVRMGRLAGDHAFAQHAYQEAIECYQAVRERLTPRLPSPDAAAELDSVIEQMGSAYTGAARWEEAAACYQELLARTTDPERRGRLHRQLAQVLADTGATALDRAVELLDLAARELGDQGGSEIQRERGRVESVRAMAHFNRSEFEAAVESGSRAIQLLGDLPGTERDLIDALARVAAAEQRLGRLDAAEAGYRDLTWRARAAGDPFAEARFQDSLAVVLIHRGRLREAQELQTAVHRTIKRFAVPKVEAVLVGNGAYLLDFLGDLEGARRTYEEAVEIADRIQANFTVVHNRVGLGDVLLRLGDYGLARAALENAISLGEKIGTRQRLAHAHQFLADLTLQEGDLTTARLLVERGLAEGAAIGDTHSRRLGHPILSRILLALGDVPGAEAAARSGLDTAHTGGFVLDEGRNLVALGQALWARGARAEATDMLERGGDIFRQAGANYLLAEALSIRAITALQSRRRASSAALDEALRLARAAGARPLQARIIEAQKGLTAAASARR
jgi:DNA-binding SARP family transcriptional activator